MGGAGPPPALPGSAPARGPRLARLARAATARGDDLRLALNAMAGHKLRASLTLLGIDNAVDAYDGELTYVDTKRGGATVGIDSSSAVLWTRVRGLHLSQAGSYPEPTSAALFDLALLAYKLDFSRLRHPPAIYIPKSESAHEALWWRDVFQAVATAKGQHPHAIKAMALVEAFPMAYECENFAYNLRDHLLALDLG